MSPSERLRPARPAPPSFARPLAARAALLLALAAAPAPAAAAGDAARGRALVQKAECTRCHEVPGLESASREASCVGCHRWMMAAAADPAEAADARAVFPLWDRHVERVRTGHFTQGVPSLHSIGRRLRPAWVRAFLDDPSDVRPNLRESMIRPGLSAQELDDVTAFLVADAGRLSPRPPPKADPALVAAGARLFGSKTCAVCHLFGARPFASAGPAQLELQPLGPRALAPDLAHVRERMRPEALVPWLLDPKALKPDTAMPALGLTEAEATALAAFLLHGDPGTPRPPPARAAAKAPKGRVTWTDVDERVFSRLCIHCHMDEAGNGGDGGPGNSGGFGYARRGLSFESYEALLEGALGPDGTRRSVLEKGAGGVPPLLARLRARIDENARDFVRPGHAPGPAVARAPDAPGMPMALPALSPDDLALVEAWLAQGHPGPAPGKPSRSLYFGAGTAGKAAASETRTREGPGTEGR